jgi:hypothetical protein
LGAVAGGGAIFTDRSRGGPKEADEAGRHHSFDDRIDDEY